MKIVYRDILLRAPLISFIQPKAFTQPNLLSYHRAKHGHLPTLVGCARAHVIRIIYIIRITEHFSFLALLTVL